MKKLKEDIMSCSVNSEYLLKRNKNLRIKLKFWLRARKIIETIKTLNLDQTNKILEIGASDGALLRKMKKNIMHKELVGIEPFIPAIKMNSEDGVLLLEGVGENLPFQNGRFNVVIIASVLEHLQDPRKTFEEVKRVLRPKGYLIISSVNPKYDSFADRFNLKIKDHLQVWGIDKISDELISKGFKLCSCQRYGLLFFKFYNLVVATV